MSFVTQPFLAAKQPPQAVALGGRPAGQGVRKPQQPSLLCSSRPPFGTATAPRDTYLHCAPQVCELLAKNAWKQVRELLKSASPTNKASEGCCGRGAARKWRRALLLVFLACVGFDCRAAFCKLELEPCAVMAVPLAGGRNEDH